MRRAELRAAEWRAGVARWGERASEGRGGMIPPFCEPQRNGALRSERDGVAATVVERQVVRCQRSVEVCGGRAMRERAPPLRALVVIPRYRYPVPLETLAAIGPSLPLNPSSRTRASPKRLLSPE